MAKIYRSLLAGTSKSSVDGSRSWSAAFGLTNRTHTVRVPATATVWSTNISANGSFSVSHLQNRNGVSPAITQFWVSWPMVGAHWTRFRSSGAWQPFHSGDQGWDRASRPPNESGWA